MRNPFSRFLAFLKRSLAAGPAAAYFTGKKVEELGPLLPSKKLVLATAACFLALSALSAALLLCVVLTGEAPPSWYRPS